MTHARTHARTHAHGANYNLPPASRAGDKNSPRLLHAPAKFEKNTPNGHRVIRKTKRGAGRPVAGRLNILLTDFLQCESYFKFENPFEGGYNCKSH